VLDAPPAMGAASTGRSTPSDDSGELMKAHASPQASPKPFRPVSFRSAAVNRPAQSRS
jgi:hypothetical protein